MTTYTWIFETLDVYPTFQTVSNAVVEVHWRMVADDGAGHTAEAYGSQRLGPIYPNDFTAFEQLTHTQIKNWVEAEMGELLVTGIKASLDAKIAAEINPPVVSLPPPWA